MTNPIDDSWENLYRALDAAYREQRRVLIAVLEKNGGRTVVTDREILLAGECELQREKISGGAIYTTRRKWGEK